MDPLKPIPVPPSHRWREFRIRFMPVVTFVAVLASIVFIWKDYVAPPTLVGQVYVEPSFISSYQPGRIVKLMVNLYDTVTNGQVLAVISPSNPETIQALKARTEAESEYVKNLQEPLVQNAQLQSNFGRLLSDYWNFEVELADVETQLNEAQLDADSHHKMWLDGLIPVLEYQPKETRLKNLKGRQEKLQQGIAALKPMVDGYNSKVVHRDSEEIGKLNSLAEKVAKTTGEADISQYNEIVVKATGDGVISVIHQNEGANIIAGSPILTLTPNKSDVIIGYMRQPLTFIPKKGDTVVVRSRSRVGRRQMIPSKIDYVSSQMEQISTNLLQATTRGVIPEMGLAVRVKKPREFSAVPGEIVDLLIQAKAE